MKALDRLEALQRKLEKLENTHQEIEECTKELEDTIFDIECENDEHFESLEELRDVFLEMHGKSIHLHSEDYNMEKMRIIFRDLI